VITAVTNQEAIKTTAALAHKIWNQHYVPIIGQAQVDYMVGKFQSEEAIEEQLNKGYRYFLIHHEELACGYLALVPDAENHRLMISKIYVDAQFRGLHLGSKLLDFAVEEGLKGTFTTLWLTVNKHNSNSIAWYKKRGFAIKEALVMDIGNGYVMDDYVMELPLKH